jgi:phage terminase large subunit GpA-like protein
VSVTIDPFPHYAGLTLPDGETFIGNHGGLALSHRTTDALLPREKTDSWKWICENVHTKKGQPFNYIDFPWVEGICRAWDDPLVRRIFYMAGSRLGKTETFLSLMLCAEHHDPDVGMIGGSTETLVTQTIRDRFYPMMEKTHATRDLCPPPHRRNAHKVRTSSFIIHGAWSGSPTTLGDLDPRYLQALELDKWTKNSSEEADPAELFFERGAEIPDRKLAAESTPTIEGMSRIKKYVTLGTNRKYHVPCWKCGHRQYLRRNTSGNPKDGGLWWDREKDGESTPSIAAATARYICEKCEAEWGEENRKPAIRRGTWVAEGQWIDDQGEVHGTPSNAGPDESFSLSRMYGPTFSFSDYARAYEQAKGEPEKERSFANNWDGDTWVPVQVEMTWEQAAQKLCVGDWQIGEVPEQVNFLTTSVDVQIDHYVLTTWGWDREQRGYLINYGTAAWWPDVKEWLSQSYQHADGGEPLRSFVNLIDSRDGNKKDEIVDFCRSCNRASGPFVWPSMGSRPGTMDMRMFMKRPMDDENAMLTKKSKGRQIEGIYFVMINTTFTQQWLDNAIARRKPGAPMSLTMPSSIIGDEDFFSQLLNEVYDREKGTWKRVDETTIPVDFRDCVRYARAAAEIYTNGNWARVPAVRPIRTPKPVSQETQKRQSENRSNDRGRSGGFIRKKRGFVRKRS